MIFGYAETRQPRLIAGKLFSKNSNLPGMRSQYINVMYTDGQTTCRGDTGLCVASRGKTDEGMGALQGGPGGPWPAHPKFCLGGPQCIWAHQ